MPAHRETSRLLSVAPAEFRVLFLVFLTHITLSLPRESNLTLQHTHTHTHTHIFIDCHAEVSACYNRNTPQQHSNNLLPLVIRLASSPSYFLQDLSIQRLVEVTVPPNYGKSPLDRGSRTKYLYTSRLNYRSALVSRTKTTYNITQHAVKLSRRF